MDARQDTTGLVRLRRARSGDGTTAEGEGGGSSSELAVRVEIDGSLLTVYPSPGPSQAPHGDVELVIEGALQSATGQKLAAQFTQQVAFEALKPAVRVVGKGAIIPTTQGATLPIEVASLRSIRVTALRVAEQNMPQFLQVNSLEGEQELRRVGTEVWKKRIVLQSSKGSTSAWTRYGLDLSPLLSRFKGGLYRITVSFGPRDIMYDCSSEGRARARASARRANAQAGENSDGDETGDDSQSISSDDSADEISTDNDAVEASNWDFASEDSENGDDVGSDWGELWRNRTNPCHRGYYRDYYDHKVASSRNVLISDIGLLAKGSEDGSLLVLTTDLRTAKPQSGVAVEVQSYQQVRLASGTSDSDGIVRMRPEGTPYLIVARQGEQTSYLKIDKGQSLSVSHFDVGGATIKAGQKGVIYGERGVWRPGDEIHLTFVLLQTGEALPKSHPVRFELADPRGRVINTQVASAGTGGFYTFHTRTKPEATTGSYTARVRVGGATFEEPVRIEMVKPNRMKIEVDFGGTKVLQADKPVTGKLKAHWLHGTPARMLNAKMEVTLGPGKTSFERYTEYSFDDPTRSFSPEQHSVFEGNLDDQGEATVKASVSPESEAPGLVNATFVTRVFEPGGDASMDSFSIPVSPYDRYIGIRTPPGDKARGMLLTDTKHTVSVVAVDANGKPKGGGSVEVKLYQINWRWWWEKGQDESLASFVSSAEHRALATGTVQLSAAGEGSWQFEIKYPEWGRYLILARDKDGNHRGGKIIYVDWPGWAGRGGKDQPGGATVLSFSADKASVNVGEEVVLTLPTPENGRGLVSIENGSRVLKTDWIEGTGKEARYSFKATPEMAPNVYAHVTFLQPHLQAKNDVPIRTYGVIPITVSDPETKLSVVIDSPEVLAPEAKTEISVREANGKPMTYTLAVVDEGLLSLTRFSTPNLWNTFYRREALGVRTWDLYDDLAGAYGTTLERLLAIGGDADAQGAQAKKRVNRFVPLVRFVGPVTLAANEKKKHTIDIPRYVGAVRIMVVAGGERAFGSAEKSVFVKKPLMVLATLPRVLGPEEQVDLPVTVFALEDRVKSATVTVSVQGALKLASGGTQTVAFRGPGDETVRFGLVASELSGPAKVDVTVEGAGERSSQTIDIDVRNPQRRAVAVMNSAIEPGKSWTAQASLVGQAATNTAMLELSVMPPLDLARRVNELIQYPHGCIEQTTSGGFPQLYLSKLLELGPTQKTRTEENVRATIDKLGAFATSDGGFGYWPGDNVANAWGTSYAGHFLVEAKHAGYLVHDSTLNQWRQFQRSRANAWTHSGPGDGGDLDQAYRLYTLALGGSPELGAMNRLKESGTVRGSAAWQLGSAYILAGKPEIAQDLLKSANTVTSMASYSDPGPTFGSALRDEALVLETLALQKDHSRALPVVQAISKRLASDDWLSTQETAWALASIARYVGGDGRVGGNEVKAVYRWADKSDDSSKNKDAHASRPVMQIELPVDSAAVAGPGSAVPIFVQNNGSQMLYATVVMSGVPPYGQETDAALGLGLSVRYLLPSGDALADVEELDQGTDLVAEVTVKHTGVGHATYENVALTYPVAAGWEIRNERFELGRANLPPGTDFQDIRDDRICTYFSIKPNESKSWQVKLSASYVGHFYLPAAIAEVMYDGRVQARQAGRWVDVVRPGTPVASGK